jgi:hypothetical protein
MGSLAHHSRIGNFFAKMTATHGFPGEQRSGFEHAISPRVERVRWSHSVPKESAMTNTERRELTAAELDLVGGGAIFLEYEGVTGGTDRPASQTVTMLDYEGSPVVTYSVVGSWGRR